MPLSRALFYLLLLSSFALGAIAPMQDDSWWHLRMGEVILEKGPFYHKEDFSYALPDGAEWTNHEWLAQVLMYLIYQAAGLPLLTLAFAGINATLFGLLWFSMPVRAPQRFLLLCAILPWHFATYAIRPHCLSLLAVSLLIYLLQSERFRFIPALFLFWASAHGGVAIGGYLLVLVTLYGLLWGWQTKPLLITTALSGAATLLTPLGFHILEFPLRTYSRSIQLSLNEWKPVDFSNWQELYFLGLLAFFTVLLASHLWQRRGERSSNWVHVLPLLYLPVALDSVRNISVLQIPMVVSLGFLLAAKTPKGSFKESFDKQAKPILIVLLLFVILGLSAAYTMRWDRLGWDPLTPEMNTALRQAPTPIFNSYNIGGALIWHIPERQIFVDNRQDPYPMSLLKSAIEAEFQANLDPLMATYKFKSVLVGSKTPLAKKLRQQGWKETSEQADYSLFVDPHFLE